MQAVLAHPHSDRRQLGDLVALREGYVDALRLAEATAAASAARRPVLDELVHQLERKQPTVPALLSRLAAGAAARTWLARPRQGRGRIPRGRQRRVTRAPVQTLLQLGDAGLEPPVRLDQLAHPQQQTDRRLPIAIQNRLRLGTLHRVQLRRAEAGPSPPASHGEVNAYRFSFSRPYKPDSRVYESSIRRTWLNHAVLWRAVLPPTAAKCCARDAPVMHGPCRPRAGGRAAVPPAVPAGACERSRATPGRGSGRVGADFGPAAPSTGGDRAGGRRLGALSEHALRRAPDGWHRSRRGTGTRPVRGGGDSRRLGQGPDGARAS
jgi:hypothetical protein